MFPLSPLRTPLTPSQKNKECNPSLGGTGGTLFTQHYSCPAVLRCSVGSTRAAFRELLSYVKNGCLNRTGTSPALNRQCGNIRVAAFYAISLFSTQEMFLQVSLWSCVRALPPLNVPMIFQLQSQTCHKLVSATRPLDIEQDCSFRMPLKNENALMKSFGIIDSSWEKFHLPNFRSDSFQKFATASQTLGFEKAVFAPN